MRSKPVIVLDLDNTLISSASRVDEDMSQDIIDAFINKVPYMVFEDHIIFERPYLHPFLDFVYANFDVVVWTAAELSYANAIVEELIDTSKRRSKYNNRLLALYTREDLSNATEIITRVGCNKPLEYLVSDIGAADYTLIDDKPEMSVGQEDSVIIVKPYDIGNATATDRELLIIKDMLIKKYL